MLRGLGRRYTYFMGIILPGFMAGWPWNLGR